MSHLLLSVVIPTRNRRHILPLTLQALEAQTGLDGPFEVIVADDGSTDGTPELLEGGHRFRFLLRSIRLTPGGPARARNRAIGLAQAARILLLGDDTPPRADALARHVEAAAGREVGVQGRIEWEPGAPITPVMRFLAPEGPQFYFKGLRHGEPIPYTAYYVSNYSAPTRWFLEDPFDEEFPAAAFEDTELAYRWTLKGRTTIYWENAVCAHRHHYERIETFLTRQRAAGLGARRAVRLHPGLAAKTILQPFAVGVLHGARYGLRLLSGNARDEDRWDLLCRGAFFQGLFARSGSSAVAS
jgi:glycosyltransferase involved in cell wall biosynthesis